MLTLFSRGIGQSLLAFARGIAALPVRRSPTGKTSTFFVDPIETFASSRARNLLELIEAVSSSNMERCLLRTSWMNKEVSMKAQPFVIWILRAGLILYLRAMALHKPARMRQ